MRAKCKCGQVLDIPREIIGEIVECPSCGLRLRIQGPKIDRDRPVRPKVVKETPRDTPEPPARPSVDPPPNEDTPTEQAAGPSSSTVPDRILPCPACGRSVRILAEQAGAGSICPYCGFELQSAAARRQTTYRRAHRSPVYVQSPDPLVYQWIFTVCLAYLSLLVFLPWVKFGPFSINAIRIMDLSFRTSEAGKMLSGIAILTYVGSVIGGWVVLGRSFARGTGIPRMRLWFGLAAGMLILFCVGWFMVPGDTGPIRLSIFDFIAPTFYIGIAAGIGGFVASIIPDRGIGSGTRLRGRRYR